VTVLFYIAGDPKERTSWHLCTCTEIEGRCRSLVWGDKTNKRRCSYTWKESVCIFFYFSSHFFYSVHLQEKFRVLSQVTPSVETITW